ncbi:unnamed protein product [Protopolystoma xenopodis]|uniref:Uncharacterized protein n=1 Tax=Protopolystoma xenopodis TaxID=117903 RepID=A0A3S5BZK2_9PLAT|nr:unnamed protein product [Protopolystoma xenopodis]
MLQLKELNLHDACQASSRRSLSRELALLASFFQRHLPTTQPSPPPPHPTYSRSRQVHLITAQSCPCHITDPLSQQTTKIAIETTSPTTGNAASTNSPLATHLLTRQHQPPPQQQEQHQKHLQLHHPALIPSLGSSSTTNTSSSTSFISTTTPIGSVSLGASSCTSGTSTPNTSIQTGNITATSSSNSIPLTLALLPASSVPANPTIIASSIPSDSYPACGIIGATGVRVATPGRIQPVVSIAGGNFDQFNFICSNLPIKLLFAIVHKVDEGLTAQFPHIYVGRPHDSNAFIFISLPKSFILSDELQFLFTITTGIENLLNPNVNSTSLIRALPSS